MSVTARIYASLKASIGDVVFGMEDGTVSIFGLVFGVAMSTNDPRTVLVAGASGAASGAGWRASPWATCCPDADRGCTREGKVDGVPLAEG